MANIPIPTTIIRLGSFVLFDCNFAMPRVHDVGLRPRDSVVCGNTLWLRCYAVGRDGGKYKFKFYEKEDGRQGLVVRHFISRSDMERLPSHDKAFEPVRAYLGKRVGIVKEIMEKKRTKKTIFHIKKKGEVA